MQRSYGFILSVFFVWAFSFAAAAPAAADGGHHLPATLFHFEHDIPLGGGKTMRVREEFTLEALLRHPRRGILMISSSAFNRQSFSIPVPGYNATEMLAREGFFVWTADYLGVGESYKPANGNDATRAANIAALQRVINLFRLARGVPKVDILAEGYGSTFGPYLATDPSKVRSLIMSSTIYKYLNGGPLTDPDFVALILSDPDGYVPVPPGAYDAFLTGAPPAVKTFHDTTQAGDYPVSLLPAGVPFPFFDPGVARVPGLIIYGLDDTLAGPGDPEELAADYGTSGAELVYLEGAGHAPRVESPEIAARFWAEVYRFLGLDGQ